MGRIIEVYREFLLSGSDDYLQIRQSGEVWEVSYLSVPGLDPRMLKGQWDDPDRPMHWIPDMASCTSEPRLFLSATNSDPDGYVLRKTGFEVLSHWKTGLDMQRIEGNMISDQMISRGSFERFLRMLEDEKVYGRVEVFNQSRKVSDFVF